MFIKKFLLGSCVVLSFLISGCDESIESQNGIGNNEDRKNRKKGMPRLDIGDASSLVVVSNSSNTGGRIAIESSNLYKITTSGSLEEVKFLNADNTEIDPNKTQTSIRINNIVDVNKTYLVLEGEFMAWDTLGNTQYYNSLLVHKADGSIYDFKNSDIGNSPIFEDEGGSFYYKNYNRMIMQIDVSDPNLLRKNEFLPTGQTANSFGVDLKGNAIYEYELDGERKFRVRKKNAGLYEINITKTLPGGPFVSNYLDYYVMGTWIGTNGKIYFDSYTSGYNGYKPHFHTLTVNDDNTVAIDTVWNGEWSALPTGMMNPSLGVGSSAMKRIQKEKSVLFVYELRAWEFFEETNTVVDVVLPTVDKFDDFFHSDHYLYYRSGTTIHKISLDDYSAEVVTLPQGDEFEIYTLSVDSHDVLQLSALRFSDGKKIIAQIDSNGVFSIVDEEIDKEATLLQRLN